VAHLMNLLNMQNKWYGNGGRAALADAIRRVQVEFERGTPQRQSALAQLRVIQTFMEFEVPLVRETMFILENAVGNPAEAFDKMRFEILPLLLALFLHRGNRNYAEGIATWLILLHRMEQQGHPAFDYIRENYQFFNERSIELLHKYLASESARVEVRHEYDLMRKTLQMFSVMRELKDFVEYELGLERAEEKRSTHTEVKFAKETAKAAEFMFKLVDDAALGTPLERVATGKNFPHSSYAWSATPGIGVFTNEQTMSPPPGATPLPTYAVRVRAMLQNLHKKLLLRRAPPVAPANLPVPIKRRADGARSNSNKGETLNVSGGKSAWYNVGRR